ncbi:MAG: tyrosine-protein phosphatase [Bdellovibrionales bacterium]|nr:tyrosine-protein phosphatase [Bdellovibrionales bacterium]
MPIFMFLLQFSYSLVSPFPSEVVDLNIPNSHIVEGKTPGYIVRGMRPRTDTDLDELLQIGITDILIFKNSTIEDDSTEKEISQLVEKGIKRKHIQVIPFQWKDIDSFETACLQTIDALNIMKSVSKKKSSNLFFHCTVGEDRTGYLAAMYKILFQKMSFTKAWNDEMCENGYADGNPRKPKTVVAEIHKNITPVFQKMLHKIKYGYISADNLDKSECSFDPARSTTYKPIAKFTNCKPSSKYDPSIR